MLPAVQTPALRMPAMGVCRNPLLGLTASDMQPVAIGVPVFELQPERAGLLLCYLNGEPLPRLTPHQIARHQRLQADGNAQAANAYLVRNARRALNWRRTLTRPGDVLAWHDQPQDKDALRGVLMIAAAVLVIANPAFLAAFPGGAAGFGLVASIGINLLLPPSIPEQQAQQAPGAIYNASLSGNQARLDQPIWRNCGLVKITPPFAAQPYYEYRDIDGDDLDNEQYYHAVFAVGIGNHTVKSVMIGRTPIGHFADVLVAQYLAPGVQPSQALCNVVTSTEVSQLVLESGRYAGGYAACQPGRRVAAIGIDVMCPMGLGKSGALTVTWRVETREIDQFGRPVGAWQNLGAQSRTANTNTPQRWSTKYTLSAAIRCEVRVVRTDIKDTDTLARHELQWIGLRAYLADPAPLNAETAHYEVVMRASEQLSSLSQRDFSLIAQALVRTWDPVSGWGAEVETRNPAWWLADLWTSSVWGEGLADDRIALAELYAFAQTCDERQDRFDHTFDTAMNAWDAAQLIARAGRARCFRRFGVNTLARDELVTLPTTALTHRNCAPDSMSMREQLPTRDVADGVVVEYQSNVTWDTAQIECPCPGYSVTDPADPRYDALLSAMAAPVYMTLQGIKGATHAEREGLYEAAVRMYRTRTVSAKTEMQGAVLACMDAVRWLPTIAGYGQTGDVAFWDAATLVMGLTEPPDFTAGTLYLTLVRDDLSLTDPVAVTPGPTEWDVTLPAAPDFSLVLDDGTRERPKFLLGTLADCDELVKVTAIADGGKSEAEDGEDGAQLYDVAAVVDDARVHGVDVHLLPGPGVEQDVVEFPAGDPGGGVLPLINLNAHDISAGEPLTSGDTWRGYLARFSLANDGAASSYTENGVTTGGSPITTTFANEWVNQAIEPSMAADYEVRATDRDGRLASLSMTGDALGTWLNLGTSRAWTLTNASNPFNLDTIVGYLRIEIREVGSSIVQATANVTLSLSMSEIST